MTAEVLDVGCADGDVGTLTRSSGRITFSYDVGWQARDDATPLSVSMPLTARDHPPRVVEPFLWGLLPDNDAVVRRWARDIGVSATNLFGILAAVGEDLPGAMSIVPPGHPGESPNDSGDVEWLDEAEVAGLLRAVRQDQTAWHGGGAEWRWSLAGAQAKIALFHDGTRWGRPTGRLATTHILKPAIAALDDHDLNEHLCLRAARQLGLRVASTTVAAFGQERAIVVERYDRRIVDGTAIRIHQEDLCQALAVHPSQKYQNEGGPGPADVVRVLRSQLPHDQAEDAVVTFVDALAYNWIIAGPDAHAKNYSLLLSGPQVRLAPLYDVASALAYPEFYEPKIHLAMKIGGQYRLSAIGRGAWEVLARELRIDAEVLVGRIARMAEQTPAALAHACSDPSVVAIGGELPTRLLDAVTVRARRCATLLDA